MFFSSLLTMKESTIRFEGEAFHLLKWTKFLTDLGFRMAGPQLEKGSYVSGGNHVVTESRGFVTRDEQQGFEWQLTLKTTRRWEGTIKFYSVLLAAFAMPQRATVTHAGHVFADRQALRKHAEAVITQEFSLDELIDQGVYQKGDGVRFM
jgi:hypothetical protein